MLDRQCLENIFIVYDIFVIFVTVTVIRPTNCPIQKKMDILNEDIARRTNAILKILYAFLIVHNIVN